jgi:hypothetical protein
MHRCTVFATILITTCILRAPAANSADMKYILVSREAVMTRLKDAPRKNKDREAELVKVFRDSGCQPTEQAVKGLREPNVLCVLKGSTDSTIVVGGHLDHVADGTGIVDDWSGASMLPSLYQGLAGQPRLHTFIFIGFAGEEEGMVGSAFYARHLSPEQRKQIAAMVNLECLGVTPTKVWTSHSDPLLIRMLVAVAQTLHLPVAGVNVEKVGTTDSESFAHYAIPRITIHSITQDTLPLLHSSADNITAIKEDLYYDSYRLITPYLVLLDQQLSVAGPQAH